MPRYHGRSASGRSKTINVYTSVDVDVDVDIPVDELEDEDLHACIEEARRRGLLGGTTGTSLKQRKERLGYVLEDMMARRTANAVFDFEQAFFSDEDAELREAYRAMQNGNWSTAICLLDKALFPVSLPDEALPKHGNVLTSPQESGSSGSARGATRQPNQD